MVRLMVSGLCIRWTPATPTASLARVKPKNWKSSSIVDNKRKNIFRICLNNLCKISKIIGFVILETLIENVHTAFSC